MLNIETAKNIKIKTVNSPHFESDNILIYKDDILKINSIPNNSVDLIVTSQPYNVDIHYNSHVDDLSYEDYLEFTQKWIRKCFHLAKNSWRGHYENCKRYWLEISLNNYLE